MSTSPRDICNELFRIMRNMKAALSGFAEESGLTLQQAGALHVLYEHNGLLMGAMADEMHCDASNVTGIIDRLVVQGYVVRQESPQDRRAKQITLTAKGEAFVKNMIERAPAELGCTKLNQHELTTLYGYLRRLDS